MVKAKRLSKKQETKNGFLKDYLAFSVLLPSGFWERKRWRVGEGWDLGVESHRWAVFLGLGSGESLERRYVNLIMIVDTSSFFWFWFWLLVFVSSDKTFNYG